MFSGATTIQLEATLGLGGRPGLDLEESYEVVVTRVVTGVTGEFVGDCDDGCVSVREGKLHMVGDCGNGDCGGGDWCW